MYKAVQWKILYISSDVTCSLEICYSALTKIYDLFKITVGRLKIKNTSIISK